MNLCTSICINNAIVAASADNAAAASACSRKSASKDEDVSVWFGLLAMAIVFVVIPAIVVGIICLVI